MPYIGNQSNIVYAETAFNLPVDSLFTYVVPPDMQPGLVPGCRVLASFGSRNITGIVIKLTDKSDLTSIKPISRVLDSKPALSPEMIEFCKWISSYYACPIGEVIFSSLPKGIMLESKVLYSVNGEIDLQKQKITGLQYDVIDALEKKPLTIKQIENKLGKKTVRSIVNVLEQKNIITGTLISPREKIKTRIEKFVKFRMKADFAGYTPENLEIFITENKIRSEKQRETLRYLVFRYTDVISAAEIIKEANSSPSALEALEKREIIEIEAREVQRDVDHEFSADVKIVELNPDQKSVLKEITDAADKSMFKPFLLFGVTGSGKTQVYIESIEHILKKDKTAIVLVPEISLTPQLIHRFKTYFGDIIGVIHSKLTEGQKFDVYTRIGKREIKIVIGARSALFAPLNEIGIIIVDEEHDNSYKQTEKNPRYNARDSAVIRAKLNNAVVVLGSATPSLESFYNYRAGKYHLLELPHRALKTRPPEVEIVDMLGELKSANKFVKYETPEQRFLSSRLINYINSALKAKESVILLQNRRGYSAYSECQECGNVRMCINCDITLIYHKAKDHLRCHYCGHTERLPEKCEICSSTNLVLKGTGTEKVEEEIARLFPKAKLRRMDADTVKGKDAHRKILKSFHDREFDILIGTQMISKGLDFPNVSLVGVISADIGLLNPDFRSNERTYQLLSQVAGRPGRANDFGRVLVQTMHADNFIFPFVANHDYTGFYEKEIGSRLNHNYPPFSRMTLIEASDNLAADAGSLASKIYLMLKDKLKTLSGGEFAGVEIMLPAPALIYKIKNSYRYHLIIKAIKKYPRAMQISESLVASLYAYLAEKKLSTHQRVIVDVDPLSFY